MGTELRFTAPLWAHPGHAAWHFVTLPTDVAEVLRDQVPPRGPGFGSVRVAVTIGTSTWDTSVFPDRATGSFVLPVKKDVRRANDLIPGDAVEAQLRPLQSGLAR